MKPHKHAELIKAWADGAEIEVLIDNEWRLSHKPLWELNWRYRIKPEPKADVVNYVCLITDGGMTFFGHCDNNLKLTFDGETGELKDAEVIK